MSIFPIESENLLQALKNYLYLNHLRQRTPPKPALVNGEYTVYASRLFDHPDNDRIENHEVELLRGIKRCVKTDDDVVIIGGGWGVSTIACATLVESNGQVVVYEASGELVSPLRRSTWLNDVEDFVEVRHAAVGNVQSVWGGDTAEAESPSSIPDCDVLVLDCEGAENQILAEMEISPRDIVVEHHGHLGASRNIVRGLLEDLDYEIEEHEYEVEEDDIGIFTAHSV